MKNLYKLRYALKLAACFSYLLFFSITSKAQDQPYLITGVVKDKVSPLVGVNISLKNKNRGTVSNLDGTFAINVVATDTLVFSSMGYKTKELPFKGKTELTILLDPIATSLDQVIINAGYYKVTEKEKTGSISKISTEAIENQIITNPIASLQGKMLGVNVTQSSGVPGSGFKIAIRGKNSLQAGNEPLYIIDGIPFSATSLSSKDVSGAILPFADFSPFSFLNPADIESIEVLKDADATAIYGSRGANGVVLITTKKQRTATTKFSITAKSSLGQIAKKQPLLNTQQYLRMREQAFANDGISDYPPFAYDINGTWNRNRYTDWQEKLLGGTAYTEEYQATVSGGTKATSFLLSGGYHNQTTVFPDDDRYRRVTGLAKVNHHSPRENFKISLSTAYTYENNRLPESDLSYQALILPPNAPSLYNEDGTLNWEEGAFNNPLAVIEGDLVTKRNSLLVSSQMEILVTKNIHLKTNAGYQSSNLTEYRTYPHTRFPPQYGLGSEASAIYTNDGKRVSWLFEPQLSYHYNTKKSKLNVLMGYTAQKETSISFAQYAEGFADNEQLLNLSAANFISVTNDMQQVYTYQAIFGRLNYSYENRYTLNLTGRRDGSSRFGSKNRFANFGAVGVAWLFSEESFIANTMPWLSHGKLRGSYGVTGNDKIGDYQYYNSYSSSGTSYNGVNGLYPTALYNPNFGWEKSKKFEIALELGWWKDRLTTQLNYYNNRSSNQLVNKPLSATTGFSSLLGNLNALVENRGWELEMTSRNIDSKKWKWDTSFNITIPKNILLKFPNLENSTYANTYVIGQPITIQKVLQFTGVDPQTGVYTFKDYNGDGQITIPDDRQAIVDTAPTWYGGISNTIGFENLQVDVFFQFTKQIAQNINRWGTTPGTMNNQPITVLDAWNMEGNESNTQAYTTGFNYERTVAAYNLGQSDAAYSDASFLRLKNVSLSYRIPNIFNSNSFAKVYLQGQNLVTFTNFTGQDPEQIQGFIPVLRMVGAGITLTF